MSLSSTVSQPSFSIVDINFFVTGGDSPAQIFSIGRSQPFILMIRWTASATPQMAFLLAVYFIFPIHRHPKGDLFIFGCLILNLLQDSHAFLAVFWNREYVLLKCNVFSHDYFLFMGFIYAI